MTFRTFITWTGIGAVLCRRVHLAGLLPGGFDFIKHNLDAVLIAIVLVSVLPMVVEALLERRRAGSPPGLRALSPEERSKGLRQAQPPSPSCMLKPSRGFLQKAPAPGNPEW